jgi:WD40 repeat protein/DNA-binding winged helix-turn-helix (wHTH) protein
VYEFGGFQLDPARHLLLRRGHPVAIPAKLFETLVLLVENRGRVLEKDELIEALWPDTFVEEGSLSQNIFLLRKLLGDDRNGHSFIHTAPRKGYQFIATVTETEASTPAPAPEISDYWARHSPFRGLRVFEPEDAWLFFGRDAQVHDLLLRLGRSPVVAMVGNSGSGKSSLLRAGLIPALQVVRHHEPGAMVGGNGSGEPSSAGVWRIAVLRPSAAPFDYLAEALPSQLAPELSVGEQAEFISDCRTKLSAGGETLRNTVTALVLAATETAQNVRQTPVLLVVDQFEELFTLTSKREVRERYIESLLAAARCDGAVPVHLVLALRADFYGHCLDHPALSRCLEKNLYNVPRMTPEQLRETIEERLHLVGGRAEPGLVESLLDDVGTEPGNLALMEHALGQLWERCGGPGCIFTNRAYTEIGRLRGALGRHADEVYQALENDEQRRLAQRIFLELVHLGEGAQDTRRRVAKAELLGLAERDQVEKLLGQLASSRLIATGREDEETFVEVSHEALIREWPALREWISQNREELGLERRLLQSAEEWQELKQDAGALLQGARLAQAEDWLGRHPHAPELVRDYVRTSVQARALAASEEKEAQQRELRRFRWFSYTLAILALIAVGAAAFAYHLRTLEKSRALAAQTEELIHKDHGQALNLAIQSWQTAHTEEAHLAVAKAFPGPLLSLSHDDVVNLTLFSPDGERILSASSDHTARLWSANDGRLLAILGHDDAVKDAEFSPNGDLIVTASDDHTARLWNGKDGKLIAILRGHTAKLTRATFSADGRRIVTCGFDHTARVWNSADGRLLLTLQGHSESVWNAQFSPDGQRIVTASQDKTARIWDSANGLLIATINHSDIVSDASYSPDGRLILTGSYDNTARIWGAADQHLLSVLQHHGPVLQTAFSPDGERIATASLDGAARLWDGRTGRLVATLQHEGVVNNIEFSRDGRRVATASFDQTARVWSSSDGRLLAVMQGHTSQLYGADFSPSGDQIVTGGADHLVRTWSLRSGVSSAVLGHSAAVQNALFSPDGRLIATSGNDHTVRLWTPDGQLRFTLKAHTDYISRVLFSPNSQLVLTASWDGTARIWSSNDGQLLSVLRGHTGKILDASFSADGLQVVTAGEDHTARIRNSENGGLVAVLEGHTDSVVFARFLSDGRILTAGNDRTARAWNSVDRRLLATVQTDASAPDWSGLFPNRDRAVSIGKDGTAEVWNIGDGRLELTLKGHSARIASTRFSPDGRQITTTSLDHTARIWSADNGVLLNVLKGHADVVLRSAYSADAQRIATASNDMTAKVWNVGDGHLLTTLQGHKAIVVDANFSPDGRSIVTASYDLTARIWHILTLDDIERILSK